MGGGTERTQLFESSCFTVKTVDASVYLERVAGVVWRGLVSEGLAEKKRAFVVDLVPVFAIAHIQGGFNVALAFLVPQVDLQT